MSPQYSPEAHVALPQVAPAGFSGSVVVLAGHSAEKLAAPEI